MTEGEYWDTICEKADKEGVVSDNWHKRGALVKRLLKYNFYKTRVLEVGCGLGMTAASLRTAQGMFSYEATDTSEKFCDFVKSSFGVNATVAKANNLPFETEKYNAVFCFDVLEHIHPTERLESYQEIGRVLQHGGRLFINNPLNNSHHDPDFDFTFDDNDMFVLMKAAGLRLEMFEEYSIDFADLRYQFIVLVKK